MLWVEIVTADQNAFRGGFMFFGGEKWSESEVDHYLQPASNIFKTKMGTYKVEGAGARTKLFGEGREIGLLEGLDANNLN